MIAEHHRHIGQRVKILPINEKGEIAEIVKSRDPEKLLYKVKRDSDGELHFCWDFELEVDYAPRLY